MRYFNCFNQKVKELPEVLSLDEFKGNSGGQQYNSIVVDPKDRKVLDILPNRYENDFINYFSGSVKSYMFDPILDMIDAGSVEKKPVG